MPESKTWYNMAAKANATAEIYIYDSIGLWGVSAKDFSKDLKALGNVSKIDLHLNSPGGDVFDGTAIYNLLKQHSASIEVWVEGIAASMGSVIALAGDTVHIADNAYFMIHNPSTFAWGDEHAMEKAKGLLSKVKATMVNLYSDKSGKTTEEVIQLMDDETWYIGAEAVEAGFATDVTAAIDMAASASFNTAALNNYQKVPTSLLAAIGPVNHQTISNPSAVAGTQPKPQEAIMPDPIAPQAAATAPLAAEDKKAIEDAARASALADEQKRKDGISAAFNGHIKHTDLLHACLNDMKCTVDMAKDKLLTALGEQTSKPAHSYNFVVSEGEGIIRLRADAENAIAVRAFDEKRTDGNQLVGYTMLEMARMMLQARGFNLGGMDKMAVIAAAFTHTASDFANVLANTANKAMLKGYEEAEEVFQRFTSVGTLSDFKTISRTDLGSFPSLRKVKEGAEYKYITVGDRAETAVLATYGELFGITRQAIINDDLAAFTRIPRKMGSAAIRTVGDLVFDIFLNNPTMADGDALFHANHKNLATAAGINTASIDAARVKMAEQKDGAAQLNIRPKFLLCGTADEGTAKVALGSEYEVGASAKNNTVPNSVRGIAEVISDARLTTAHNSWYLLADQNIHDTIEVMYLDGNKAPVLEQQTGWNVDGVEFKVRMDAAAKAWDAKGMVKTPKS